MFQSKVVYLPKLIRLSDGMVVFSIGENVRMTSDDIPEDKMESIGLESIWDLDSSAVTYETPVRQSRHRNTIKIKPDGNGVKWSVHIVA